MSVHGGCGRSPYVNWEIKNERMKRYIFCISLCLGVVSGGRAAAQERQPALTESIHLFDNQDLCMLLQISKRTLQRYRSVGALPYKTLGKKTYYSEEDVLTFLSNHIKDFKKEDIAFYKARIHNFFHKIGRAHV